MHCSIGSGSSQGRDRCWVSMPDARRRGRQPAPAREALGGGSGQEGPANPGYPYLRIALVDEASLLDRALARIVQTLL